MSNPEPKPPTESIPSPKQVAGQSSIQAEVSELPSREVKQGPRLFRLVFLYILPGLATLGVIAWFIIGSQFVKTENAYTKTDIASINTEISGPIVEVLTRENRPVSEGDILFRIDPYPFEIRLREVRAGLASQFRDIETLKANYKASLVALEVARSDAAFAEREHRRQSELASTRVASEARFDRARHDMDVARQKVTQVTQDLERLLVSLEGNPELDPAAHPDVMEAQAKVTRAELDLARTVVRAPFDGIATNVPDKGDYQRAGFPAMSVVSTNEVWIEANFKETQLTYVEPGQPVEVKIDAYPGWTWDGYVESISSATGQEFSILPAQNTTGNWVKVVQRIPVRIRIEPTGAEPPLRAGLSTHVSIDTGVRQGALTPRKEARTPSDVQ